MNLPLLAGPEGAMAGLGMLIALGAIAIASIISSVPLIFVLEKLFKKMNRKNIAVFEAVFLVVLFLSPVITSLGLDLIGWAVLIIPSVLFIVNVLTLNRLFRIKQYRPWLNIAIIAFLLDLIYNLYGIFVYLRGFLFFTFKSSEELFWVIIGILLYWIIPALLWAAWFAILGKVFEKRLK